MAFDQRTQTVRLAFSQAAVLVEGQRARVRFRKCAPQDLHL